MSNSFVINEPKQKQSILRNTFQQRLYFLTYFYFAFYTFSESYKCDVHFEKIGCYNDYTSRRYLSLKTLALTARDRGSEKYMGQDVDWWNYDIFLPQFACECAKKIEANYTTFGLQYYGMVNALNNSLPTLGFSFTFVVYVCCTNMDNPAMLAQNMLGSKLYKLLHSHFHLSHCPPLPPCQCCS